MKKLYLLALVVHVLLGSFFEAQSQVRTKSRILSRPGYNKHGKNLSNYTSGKVAFSRVKRYQAVGISLNALNYFGDLAPASSAASTSISLTRPGFGFLYFHRYGPRLSTKAQLNWGRLKGDDFKSKTPDVGDGENFPRYTRNLHFRNDIIELSYVAVIDFIQNIGTLYSRAAVAPYVFFGGALLYHNPKALVPDTDLNGNSLPEAGKYVALEPLGTEDQYSDLSPATTYSKFQLAIPGGLGVRVRLPENFDVSAEIGLRYLFTDYIDDVSGQYVDLGILDGDLAKTMSDRSRETFAVSAKQDRDMDAVNTRYNLITYVSEGDGQSYTVYTGYGQRMDPEGNDVGNVRGGSQDNDVYFMTSFQLTYILPGKSGRAKFR